MGECPDWYAVLLAAERLHCPPWELLERDDAAEWIRVARGASTAEAHAANQPGIGWG
jgi:hypothetical protein